MSVSDNSANCRAAEVLRALANARRLAILEYLCAGERSVGELERLVGLGQSALSQHLARLRRARLVRHRRAGRTVTYGIDGGGEAGAILDRVTRLFSARRRQRSRASA